MFSKMKRDVLANVKCDDKRAIALRAIFGIARIDGSLQLAKLLQKLDDLRALSVDNHAGPGRP